VSSEMPKGFKRAAFAFLPTPLREL